LHNAKSTYTIHILKTEHDNGLMEKPKNLEKLVKRLEEELLENIYIYIYIYKEGQVTQRARDRRA